MQVVAIKSVIEEIGTVLEEKNAKSHWETGFWL